MLVNGLGLRLSQKPALFHLIINPKLHIIMSKFKCSSQTIPLHFESIKMSDLKQVILPHPPIEATTPERERSTFQHYNVFILLFACVGQPQLKPIQKIVFETYHPLLFNRCLTAYYFAKEHQHDYISVIKISASILTIDNYNKHRLWLIMDEKADNVQHLEKLCTPYWQRKIKQLK